MGVEYDRIERESIYHPATIGDIPFEVIQKALRLVGRRDLMSASLACRAWRQAGVELILLQKKLNNEKNLVRFVCGMQLRSIVGFEMYSIKRIDLEIRVTETRRVGLNTIRGIDTRGTELVGESARVFSSTATSLTLRFLTPNLDCYKVLEDFFSRCLRIRNLILFDFDFRDDPSSLTPTQGWFQSLELLEFDTL
jgi:hypothetical protein